MKKPYLIVEWNDCETEAKGWLVVHNFVKGYAGGGTRMHPTVTREEVERLAEAWPINITLLKVSPPEGVKQAFLTIIKPRMRMKC